MWNATSAMQVSSASAAYQAPRPGPLKRFNERGSQYANAALMTCVCGIPKTKFATIEPVRSDLLRAQPAAGGAFDFLERAQVLLRNEGEQDRIPQTGRRHEPDRPVLRDPLDACGKVQNPTVPRAARRRGGARRACSGCHLRSSLRSACVFNQRALVAQPGPAIRAVI